MTDLRDIFGQESAKRALEIAVTGNHSLLLTGPSGCGKTRLAQAAFSIAGMGDPPGRFDWTQSGVYQDSYCSLCLRLDSRIGTVIATFRDSDALPPELTDRFDLAVAMPMLKIADFMMPPPAETSAIVAERIIASRHFADTELTAAIEAAAGADPLFLIQAAQDLLARANERLAMSTRRLARTIAVARTIATMDGAIGINRTHVAEALSYVFFAKRQAD